MGVEHCTRPSALSVSLRIACCCACKRSTATGLCCPGVCRQLPGVGSWRLVQEPVGPLNLDTAALSERVCAFAWHVCARHLPWQLWLLPKKPLAKRRSVIARIQPRWAGFLCTESPIHRKHESRLVPVKKALWAGRSAGRRWSRDAREGATPNTTQTARPLGGDLVEVHAGREAEPQPRPNSPGK